MGTQEITSDLVLDLDHLPVERRAESLLKAVRDLEPGESFWVAGRGDPHHYERFLRQQPSGPVRWLADFDLDGRWIARVART